MADLDDLLRQVSRSEQAQLDPRVCEALMLTYYDFIFHLANSFLYDPCEADDAAQETFIQAALHISQYQTGTNLKSWLAKIVLNICRGKYRRQKAFRRLENVLKRLTLQMNTSAQTPEDALIQTERRQVLFQAVDALDEKHRTPVVLRYIHGLSVAEIAQMMDENEGTIHSRLYYANRKLRDRLEGQTAVIPEKKAGLK